jgi:hypothetical protein
MTEETCKAWVTINAGRWSDTRVCGKPAAGKFQIMSPVGTVGDPACKRHLGVEQRRIERNAAADRQRHESDERKAVADAAVAELLRYGIRARPYLNNEVPARWTGQVLVDPQAVLDALRRGGQA